MCQPGPSPRSLFRCLLAEQRSDRSRSNVLCRRCASCLSTSFRIFLTSLQVSCNNWARRTSHLQQQYVKPFPRHSPLASLRIFIPLGNIVGNLCRSLVWQRRRFPLPRLAHCRCELGIRYHLHRRYRGSIREPGLRDARRAYRFPPLIPPR